MAGHWRTLLVYQTLSAACSEAILVMVFPPFVPDPACSGAIWAFLDFLRVSDSEPALVCLVHLGCADSETFSVVLVSLGIPAVADSNFGPAPV